MKINIDAISIGLDDQHIDVDVQSPRKCPHCDCNFNPNIPYATYIENDSGGFGKLFVIYFCTHCEKCFLVEYYANYLNQPNYQSSGTVENIYPHPSEKIDFSDNIKYLSKKFISIFNESYLAEQSNLLEICGIGYRKALEFLIKDYAILTNKNDIETIKPMPLNQCIEKYIDNKHIKILAKASAWIGNDETHYVRKHEQYTLESLKSFITATVSFIDSDLEYYKAMYLLKGDS